MSSDNAQLTDAQRPSGTRLRRQLNELVALRLVEAAKDIEPPEIDDEEESNLSDLAYGERLGRQEAGHQLRQQAEKLRDQRSSSQQTD